ncbi:MAG: hypothetical protein HY211_04915 [Candidatus Omnitrophica bacterium]|nr:hypothetical protein [Candidatus Omnitrophota bacterium]
MSLSLPPFSFALRPQPDLAGLEENLGQGPTVFNLGPAQIERFKRLREEAIQTGLHFDPLDSAGIRSRFADYWWKWANWLESETVLVKTISTSESDRVFLDIVFHRPELLDLDFVSMYFKVKDFGERDIPWVDLKVANLKEVIEGFTDKPWPVPRERARFRAMWVEGYLHLQIQVQTLQEIAEQLPVVLAVSAFFLKETGNSLPGPATGLEEHGLEERLVQEALLDQLGRDP